MLDIEFFVGSYTPRTGNRTSQIKYGKYREVVELSESYNSDSVDETYMERYCLYLNCYIGNG